MKEDEPKKETPVKPWDQLTESFANIGVQPDGMLMLSKRVEALIQGLRGKHPSNDVIQTAREQWKKSSDADHLKAAREATQQGVDIHPGSYIALIDEMRTRWVK